MLAAPAARADEGDATGRGWQADVATARREARALARQPVGADAGTLARMRAVVEEGLTAAERGGDVRAYSWFLEMGRAGALLAALGGRERLREATVPALLRAEETRMRAELRAAHDVAADARRSRVLARIRAARARLAQTEAAVADVIGRVRRETRRVARLVHPEALELEVIQAELAPDEALVLYRCVAAGSAALVITRTHARRVDLGPTEVITQAANLDLGPKAGAWEARSAALARLVVAPLGVDGSVQRVLVSPDGPLTAAPFGLLFAQREVVHVPSATTFVFLRRQQPARGRGVLALGNPDYDTSRCEGDQRPRYEPLPPLPASRTEAEAVGDVVLLGCDATETRLRAELGRAARWRAVHLACHGMARPEEPGLSALVLTRDDRHDGLLTALDLFTLSVNADLAVLSACDAGTGRRVRGEGIAGLARAFMLAGTPRVLSAPWKVDDEATHALMVRFYALWNPPQGTGLDAATALARARAYVRGLPRWKHPYYWAGWALWGLP